jgi:MFS superfamily sulfate permease-like transporter
MAADRSVDGRAWPLFDSLRGETVVGLGHDLAAGLTLAAIAIPEQMATARLGGLAPQIGLVAFVVATLGFAAFGASRQLSAGADSTIAPIFAGSLAGLAAVGSPHYAELAAALALMVGVMLTLAGVFKLGWVANLLSRPVITGFLAGIAVHIVISQAPAVLGVRGSEGDVYHQLAGLWARAGTVNPTAVAIGLGVLAITLAAEKLSPRIPGALIALVAATVATAQLGLDRRGLAVLGDFTGALPRPGVAMLGLEDAIPLVGLAAIVSLVVMVQTAATSRSFADADGDPDIDRDYVGVGAGSLLAGLLGAFPVNASPPRTAVVVETGGRSQYAGLLGALAALALLLFGGHLLAKTPVAALAGVLLFVAQRIFHAREFAQILRRTRAEFALAALTALLIVALPIQTGVALGIFLSLVHGVFTITRARLIPFERVPGATVWWPAGPDHHGEREPGVLVVGFQAPLSFLNAYNFRRDVVAALDGAQDPLRLLVLEASGVAEMDFTAAGILGDAIAKSRRLGVDFAIARLESVRAQAALERFGVTEVLGADHVFRSVEEAIRALAKPAAGAKPTSS